MDHVRVAALGMCRSLNSGTVSGGAAFLDTSSERHLSLIAPKIISTIKLRHMLLPHVIAVKMDINDPAQIARQGYDAAQMGVNP